VARYACGDDVPGLVLGKKDIQSSKPEIPCHNKKVSKHLQKLLNDSHAVGLVKELWCIMVRC